ncbi:deleted in malignant brain tumors 1 protein-like [Mercenaria mercenaria]|uniref:deleted in malignant brain tumors 1 protein-like n=1 Tax=Mercenaria mercenaria TaxID=6596 RepID=UPI00234E8587|nr:deleted in malignant brain tumors 1 protein-like [Mercenaria mercenaria]
MALFQRRRSELHRKCLLYLQAEDYDSPGNGASCWNDQATAYIKGAFYGRGIGPIFAQKFKCYGNEQHIKDCKFDVNIQCTHARDISIVCTECGKIDISNGYAKSISEDGKVLTAACKTGLRSNIDTSVCEAGIWSVPSIYCTVTADITDIRLVNGIGLYDGRVEVLMNGTWGTICKTSFSVLEAGAICRILFGARHWYRTFYTTSNVYGAGTGPIHIDNLDCKGTETDLNTCTYNPDVSCTNHSRDVAVACKVFPLNITNTRLVNGTGTYDGRIELQVDGHHWGTIDRRFVDLYDAQTICKTHNASLAVYFNTAIYGKGTGPILTREMNCYAEKNTINSCTLYAPYRSGSSHLYDLSIACTPCGLPDIYNGYPEAFNGTELTVTCHTGFYPNQIKMKCQNNNSWSEEQRCTPLHVFPLNISDIQLKNGYRPSEGRVEILVNGTWGTICDTNFDSADATVICKMFGLEYSSFIIKAKHYSGKGSGPIYVDKLNCTGTESHINLCSYEISNHCTHYDDVAVVCTGYQLPIKDIRLAGTNGPYHGRVELKVNGTWGTVCQDRFYAYSARAVCKMLGLTYRGYFYGARYGQGSGQIYVDRLECPASTNTDFPPLNDCKYAVDNYYNCGHNKDVSVMCYGPTLNITAARIVNGTGPYDGRAEINVNGIWGTICDQNFNIKAADLFCDLLGLRAAQYFTGAIYGEGSGPVFIDHLFCEDNDYSLSGCKYLFLNECSHGRDISVVCNECGQPDIYFWGVDFFTYHGTTLFADCSYYRTYVGKLKLTCDNQTQTWIKEGECQEYSFPLDVTEIRMADGPNSTTGRVELKSFDTWGTVCDDGFGMQEANAICSMLGYPPAVAYYAGAHYGPGTGPIFVDDLSCERDASHINNCSYITYDNCNHDKDVSVVCTGSY